MASKVLVPAAPFTKLQVKKTAPEQNGTGFIISNNDATARIAHLEHSVRFLQEQHRLMLSGLHAEIEALRERNRDLQFQLIFNKESSTKAAATPAVEEIAESTEEANLKREVERLDQEATAARGEARAAEARALQLQSLLDAQTEKLRELELKTQAEEAEEDETRGELRARLTEAERLVRRLRGDADRQRRELQCMKNSLHASLRASGLDYGYHNTYHFPPLQPTEYWREPLREEYSMAAARGPGPSRNARRPLTLPELTAQQIPRATIYANPHARGRNAYENKHKRLPLPAEIKINSVKNPDESLTPLTPSTNDTKAEISNDQSYPELKIVVAKCIPLHTVNNGCEGGSRQRPRRHHHRKQAPEPT